MKKDKFYYAYLKMLMEAESWWSSTNLSVDGINKLAHHGMDNNEIHQHLMDEIGSRYHSTAFLDWYQFGGNPPIVQYLRKVASHYANHPKNIQHPSIEGTPVHDNMVHQNALYFMKEIHTHTQSNLPHFKEVKVYRGIHTPNPESIYVPHALESWSTDKESAEKFSQLGIKDGHHPVLYSATVPRSGILMSHLAPTGFTPKEDSLYGKEEHTVFGHTLKNIERIK